MIGRLPYDAFLLVLDYLAPETAFLLFKTNRAFWNRRNDVMILQRFLRWPLDHHVKHGQVSLMTYKHRRGWKCTPRISQDAVSISIQRHYPRMLEYLLTVGKSLNHQHCRCLITCQDKKTIDTALHHMKPSLRSHLMRSSLVSRNPLLQRQLQQVKLVKTK